MARLSEAEKQEFLAFANSADIRSDLRILRENYHALLQNVSGLADEYIDFLNAMHEMVGHRAGSCRPIQGKHFRL